ncbi:MAG: M15 family metallopeptidase [Bacilli bacterium]|nr:M15 family metallopeptidase [Bacilli bacterium]
MKRKRKKNNKKKILLLLIIIILIVLFLVYILLPKNYGYKKETIEVFKENNLYEQIKDKKIYSKTLEEAINQNSFNKEYFLEYLDIKYIDDKDFISNINKLLNLGYSSKDINAIYNKIPDSVNIIIDSKYNKDIINIMNLSYFKIDNLKRYLDYDIMEVKSIYDISNIKKDFNYEDVVTYVNANLDKEYYSSDNLISNEDASKIDVLVNKYHKLDENYEPSDLTIIDSKYASGTQKLRKEAQIKFEEMASDMAKENLKIFAGSTYRSYTYQKGLYDRYVKKDGFSAAETYSARSGYSEHQLGLAVDIVNGKWDYLSENDKEYDYLINNSYKYGFILRYPRGSEYITGYMFEDWHFRYLGVELATKVFNSGLTYDEYIARGM